MCMTTLSCTEIFPLVAPELPYEITEVRDTEHSISPTLETSDEPTTPC